MRVIFAGTPAFSVPPLAALRAAGHTLVLALTQPDRPSGRGMAMRPSPVKQAAEAAGIPMFQPPTLKDSTSYERLREVRADVMVVVAYGLILPQAVLDLTRFGALNIHASVLPRWRGAAPIQRAIEAGDAESGVAIMQMEAGLDTGPVLREARTPISFDDTAGTLHDRLAAMGADNLVEVLAQIEAGTARPVPQSAAGITYAHKIDKAEAWLDWSQPAAVLERKVRAFDPFPGAQVLFAGTQIKIWSARAIAPLTTDATERPGRVLAADAEGIVVHCGGGALCIRELQRAGGKRLSAEAFLRGSPLVLGASFDAPSATD